LGTYSETPPFFNLNLPVSLYPDRIRFETIPAVSYRTLFRKLGNACPFMGRPSSGRMLKATEARTAWPAWEALWNLVSEMD